MDREYWNKPVTLAPSEAVGLPREAIVNNLVAYRADLVRRSSTEDVRDRLHAVDQRLRALGRRVA